MALTGLEIFKLLPKTNCGKCSSPTCLAFAMRLASKKASLDECPDVSAQAKAALGAASAPPIKLVTIGVGENKVEIGNETVLFRHEQTFFHQTGLAIEVSDNLSDDELKTKINQINNLKFERVAQLLKVNIIAIREVSGSPEKFANAVKIAQELSQLALILVSFNKDALNAALKICADKKPLIYAATSENVQDIIAIAKQYSCPLVVRGKNLDELANLTGTVTLAGISDLVLDSSPSGILAGLTDQVQIRRLALKKNFRALGYSTIAFTSDSDCYGELVEATTYICKYAGIVVLKCVENWQLLALVTLRQNIYTDPQKPIQVEAKLYTVGNVTENSPVLITTNFSLTYFTVESEVEGSRVPSYIVVVDTDGTSVLTAWAADKFNSEKITKAMKTYNIAEKVKHNKIIIPGGVAVLSGKLQEDLGCEVLVGPREASGIPNFLKTVWK
ncbi:MAG: acetyl-CoA decarbonylase/synthase complex subunit gamma [Candidatus Firestonebacteria bacterium]